MELIGGSLRIIRMEREWKGIQPWQWKAVRKLFPEKKRPYLKKLRKGGRPRVDDRRCFDAILWSARTGLPWRSLPARFGRLRTVERRLMKWRRCALLEIAWTRYLRETSVIEREEWRRRLEDACGRSPAFWRLRLKALLDLEWPREKSVILDACAESSPSLGGLTPPN
jgi:transposase